MEYKQVEEDLQYLAKTDERYAELKAGVEHMKNMLKSVKGSFVTNSKESVSKATEAFYADKNYIDVRDRMKTVYQEFFTLETKRQTAVLRIDVWRTLEATRRKGNVH